MSLKSILALEIVSIKQIVFTVIKISNLKGKKRGGGGMRGRRGKNEFALWSPDDCAPSHCPSHSEPVGWLPSICCPALHTGRKVSFSVKDQSMFSDSSLGFLLLMFLILFSWLLSMQPYLLNLHFLLVSP